VANIYSQKKYFNHLDYKDLTPGATMGGAAGTHGLYMHKHALHLVISLCNESTNVTRYGFEIKQSTIGAMQALAAGAFGGDLGLMDPFGGALGAGGIMDDAGYALAAVTGVVAICLGGCLANGAVALGGGVDVALVGNGVATLPVDVAVFGFGVVGICLGGGLASCVVALAGAVDVALAGNGVAGLPVDVAVSGFGMVGMAVKLDVAGTTLVALAVDVAVAGTGAGLAVDVTGTGSVAGLAVGAAVAAIGLGGCTAHCGCGWCLWLCGRQLLLW
jgi:hypothetical protein